MEEDGDEEPPPPKQTLFCYLDPSTGLVVERQYSGGRVYVHSLDDPYDEDVSKFQPQLASDVLQMGVVGGEMVDELVEELDEEAKQMIIQSYFMPDPLDERLNLSRSLMNHNNIPTTIHLRLDASEVSPDKSNLIGTIRSRADPVELKNKTKEMLAGGPGWDSLFVLEWLDHHAPLNKSPTTSVPKQSTRFISKFATSRGPILIEEKDEEEVETILENAVIEDKKGDQKHDKHHNKQSHYHHENASLGSEYSRLKKHTTTTRWRGIDELEAMADAEEANLGIDRHCGNPTALQSTIHHFGRLRHETRAACLISVCIPKDFKRKNASGTQNRAPLKLELRLVPKRIPTPELDTKRPVRMNTEKKKKKKKKAQEQNFLSSSDDDSDSDATTTTNTTFGATSGVEKKKKLILPAVVEFGGESAKQSSWHAVKAKSALLMMTMPTKPREQENEEETVEEVSSPTPLLHRGTMVDANQKQRNLSKRSVHKAKVASRNRRVADAELEQNLATLRLEVERDPPNRVEAAQRRRDVFRNELMQRQVLLRERLSQEALLSAVIAAEKVKIYQQFSPNTTDAFAEEIDNEKKSDAAKMVVQKEDQAVEEEEEEDDDDDDDDDSDDDEEESEEEEKEEEEELKVDPAVAKAELDAIVAGAGAVVARKLKDRIIAGHSMSELMAEVTNLETPDAVRDAAEAVWRRAQGTNRLTTFTDPTMAVSEPSLVTRPVLGLKELNKGYENGVRTELHIQEWTAQLQPAGPSLAKSLDAFWILKPSEPLAILKKDLTRELYLRVVGLRKTDSGHQYHREWILPGAKLIKWLETELHKLSKASPELRRMAAENRGIYPTPILQLSSLQKGVHDSHRWVLDYEVDVDRGYHYEEKIVLELQARRNTEVAVPRKYEFIYHKMPSRKGL